MMADERTGRRSLSEVLGYGHDLSDALNRFFSAGEEGRQEIRDAYSEWMFHCPHSGNICFADITFLPSSQDLSDSLTIVLTAPSGPDGDENFKSYVGALKDYQKNHYTMAAHGVFEAGMPFPGGQLKGPSVASEISRFYENCDSIENGLLLERLPPVNLSADEITPSSECVRFNVQDLGTFGDLNVTKQFKRAVSEVPIEDHWRAWLSLFIYQREEGKLKSCSGRPMRWLAAIPVGYRHPYEPAKYELVSSIFLGFDDQLKVGQVLECIRYILLNQFEANATQMAVRQGVLEGKDLLTVPASHELKQMTEAISVPTLKRYFQLLLNPAGDKVSMQLVPFDLRAIIAEQLREAAKLERVVELSKRGRVTTMSEEELEVELNRFVTTIFQLTNFDFTFEEKRVCPSINKYYFELALLAAFRNVVKHTWRKNDPSISVSLREAGGLLLVVIRNSFVGTTALAAGRAKDTGTLRAIKKYVQMYSRGLRHVGVQRISMQKEETRRKLIHEVWQTEVPLPEFEGA